MKTGFLIFIILWAIAGIIFLIFDFFAIREGKRVKDKLIHEQKLEQHTGFLKGEFEHENS